MAESKIGAKGQTTIPASVRAALGVKSGARLEWVVSPNGDVLVRAIQTVASDEERLLSERLQSVSRAVRVDPDDL
ncbi:looped-hinge helix DNA binding domain-containing protein, AbrB family [Burkholderia sp. WP9]|nr:looped-hinge helix DNA binding domain-containing protein, AbrB family [Burkholderia sp. WP9]